MYKFTPKAQIRVLQLLKSLYYYIYILLLELLTPGVKVIPQEIKNCNYL